MFSLQARSVNNCFADFHGCLVLYALLLCDIISIGHVFGEPKQITNQVHCPKLYMLKTGITNGLVVNG